MPHEFFDGNRVTIGGLVPRLELAFPFTITRPLCARRSAPHEKECPPPPPPARTHVDPNVDGRPSTHVHRLYRVDEPSKVSKDHVRKRHPNRSVVLTKENGQLQDRVRHVFSQIPGGLGKPRNLRNDGAPREVCSVVQDHYEVTPRGHRVRRYGEVIDRINVKGCWPPRS
jgi:hypothetical protein